MYRKNCLRRRERSLHYEYLRMLFGFENTSSMSQSPVDEILKELPDEVAMVYKGDSRYHIIHHELAIKNLKFVIAKMCEAKLQIKIRVPT